MRGFYSIALGSIILLSACQRPDTSEWVPKIKETFSFNTDWVPDVKKALTTTPQWVPKVKEVLSFDSLNSTPEEVLDSLKSLVALQSSTKLSVQDKHILSSLSESYENEPIGIITKSQAGHYLLSYDAHFPKNLSENFELIKYDSSKPWNFKYIYQPKGSNLRNWDERFSLTAETYLDSPSKYARSWLKSIREFVKGRGEVQAYIESESSKEVQVIVETHLPREGEKIAFLRFLKTPNSIVLLKYENRNNFISPKLLTEWKDTVRKIKVSEELLFDLDLEAVALIEEYYKGTKQSL
jgi:hypothetical protein